MSYLEKSVTNDSLAEAFAAIEHSTQKRVKKLLVVCPDRAERESIADMLAAPDVEMIGVGQRRRSAGRREAAVSGRNRDPRRDLGHRSAATGGGNSGAAQPRTCRR